MSNLVAFASGDLWEGGLLQFPLLIPERLKDKLRNIKIFRNLFKQKSVHLDSITPRR